MKNTVSLLSFFILVASFLVCDTEEISPPCSSEKIICFSPTHFAPYGEVVIGQKERGWRLPHTQDAEQMSKAVKLFFTDFEKGLSREGIEKFFSSYEKQFVIRLAKNICVLLLLSESSKAIEFAEAFRPGYAKRTVARSHSTTLFLPTPCTRG